MSFERHDEQQRFLATLNSRAAADACIDDLLDGRYLGGAD
jgi:hypothetical protein